MTLIVLILSRYIYVSHISKSTQQDYFSNLSVDLLLSGIVKSSDMLLLIIHRLDLYQSSFTKIWQQYTRYVWTIKQ